MAFEVGDLLPRSSGSASLGVEQVDAAGFSTDVRPFNHVHLTSGVFHDPFYGQSGVIRYTTGVGFTLSLDGGRSFRPLILDLQGAYDGGNEVNIFASLVGQNGVVIKERGGVTPITANDSMLIHQLNYGLAVSGATFSPNNPNSYSLATLSSNGLWIKGSGTSSVATTSVFFGVEGDTGAIGSSGSFFFAGGDDLNFITAGPITIQATSVGGVNDRNIISVTPGNISSRAFANSGFFEYRFGTHRGWHIRNVGEDIGGAPQGNFWPLPHSGQIKEMVAKHALQPSYNVGPEVVLTSTPGNIILTSNTAKTKFSTFGTRAEIFMSGVPAAFPSSDMERGDLTMLAHGLVDKDPMGQTTLAGVQARSLGLATIGINTGSGIANLMMGSGIQRYLDTAGGTSVATFANFTNVVTSSERFQRDQYYAYDSSVTGVRVFVPGCYLVMGKSTVASSATTTIFSRLAVNGNGVSGTGDNGPILSGATAAFTMHGLLNLNARDYVSLQVSTTTGTVTTVANESVLHLIYLGPTRGQLS